MNFGCVEESMISEKEIKKGCEAEKVAKKICKELRSERIILDFWYVQKNSQLDQFGIDIICQTEKGFYFLNVKSSKGGGDVFFERGKALRAKFGESFIEMYPWVVDARSMQQITLSKERLLTLISRSQPSAINLPERIKSALSSFH